MYYFQNSQQGVLLSNDDDGLHCMVQTHCMNEAKLQTACKLFHECVIIYIFHFNYSISI